MPIRILSFFHENLTWRVAQTPDDYYHRETSGLPEWLVGLPPNVSVDVVSRTFQQFPSTDHSLEPTKLSFKLTYHVGQSNLECFIFSSPEGDPFSVKISSETFASLQNEYHRNPLPRMRIAHLVIQQAIHAGLPSVELRPETPLYKTVRL